MNTKLQASDVVFVDTDIVIEAVRTHCWNAISGQCTVVTVEECAEELRRGDASKPGYVPVTQRDIERMAVKPVTDQVRAEFRLAYANADGLDFGERDLLENRELDSQVHVHRARVRQHTRWKLILVDDQRWDQPANDHQVFGHLWAQPGSVG